jgi:cation:H+ antiporter
VLVLLYAGGVYGTAILRERPMWRPVSTPETRHETPEDADEAERNPIGPAALFLALMIVLGAAGWTIAQCGAVIVDRLGISATAVGALMTATVTSLPELVTTLAAIRRGALQLAVGGIIGGNTFDVLFLTLSDIGYRDGSLYHAVGTPDFFWLTVGLCMTGILLLGLILRQRRGPAGIGFESVGILVLYGGAIALQSATG